MPRLKIQEEEKSRRKNNIIPNGTIERKITLNNFPHTNFIRATRLGEVITRNRRNVLTSSTITTHAICFCAVRLIATILLSFSVATITTSTGMADEATGVSISQDPTTSSNTPASDSSTPPTVTSDSSPTVTVPVNAANSKSIKLENTFAFMSDFATMHRPSGVAPGVSEAYYAAHPPPPVDPNKIVYLPMPPIRAEDDTKDYNYDADAQQFTLESGSKVMALKNWGDTSCVDTIGAGTVMTIGYVVDAANLFAVTDSSGSSEKMLNMRTTNYDLNVTNEASLPSTVYDSSSNKFHFTWSKTPSQSVDYASNCEIVLGCKLQDYSHAGLFFCYEIAAGPDKPSYISCWDYVITAQIVSVMLIDNSNATVLKQVDIPN